MIPKKIPKFKSEAEEAKWWYDNRAVTAKWTSDAIRTGRTTTLAEILKKARAKRGPTPTVSIRIDSEDIERARTLAAKKGLRYQTYIKMVLHEALNLAAKAG